MKEFRIVSFLPAATEMIYQLGLEDYLLGVTHECDYPPQAKSKPVLVTSAVDYSGMTVKQMDEAVTARLKSGKSLYAVNEESLRKAAPNLLITQNLCQVCGPSGNEVSQVLRALKPEPEILWQTPRNFEEILQVYEELGRKTGRLEAAQSWIKIARERIERVAVMTRKYPRKIRVAFIEWVDPLFSGGHWVSQMLSWAGGEDINSRDGEDSVRITWESILDYQPEVIIAAPCGFALDKAHEQALKLAERPGWKDLPAVREGKVFAVDANAYFARPGPQVVDGVELLAHLIHPEDIPWTGPKDAFRIMSLDWAAVYI